MTLTHNEDYTKSITQSFLPKDSVYIPTPKRAKIYNNIDEINMKMPIKSKYREPLQDEDIFNDMFSPSDMNNEYSEEMEEGEDEYHDEMEQIEDEQDLGEKGAMEASIEETNLTNEHIEDAESMENSEWANKIEELNKKVDRIYEMLKPKKAPLKKKKELKDSEDNYEF